MHDGHDSHMGDHQHAEAASATREEAVALLGYMVAHNEHHAEELTELVENMRSLGLDTAAEEIEESVEDFREGNLKLRSAFALLQKE